MSKTMNERFLNVATVAVFALGTVFFLALPSERASGRTAAVPEGPAAERVAPVESQAAAPAHDAFVALD